MIPDETHADDIDTFDAPAEVVNRTLPETLDAATLADRWLVMLRDLARAPAANDPALQS